MSLPLNSHMHFKKIREKLAFQFLRYLLLLLFLSKYLSLTLLLFVFLSIICFTTSIIVGLVVNIVHKFSLCELFLIYYFKNFFSGYQIVLYRYFFLFFFLSAFWNILFHCLLVSIASHEKYVMILFPCKCRIVLYLLWRYFVHFFSSLTLLYLYLKYIS